MWQGLLLAFYFYTQACEHKAFPPQRCELFMIIAEQELFAQM